MKLFDLSLPRTGTRSSHKAAKLLGFKAIHHNPKLQADFAASDYPIKPKWYALFHIVHFNPDKILAAYPDAVFMLRQSPLAEWLSSWEAALNWDIKNQNVRPAKRNAYLVSTFGAITYERDRWSTIWHRHAKHIEQHRRNGIEIHKHDHGWESLCRITKKQKPECDYPHTKSKARRGLNRLGC